jgi:hypothetical protein
VSTLSLSTEYVSFQPYALEYTRMAVKVMFSFMRGCGRALVCEIPLASILAKRVANSESKNIGPSETDV